MCRQCIQFIAGITFIILTFTARFLSAFHLFDWGLSEKLSKPERGEIEIYQKLFSMREK